MMLKKDSCPPPPPPPRSRLGQVNHHPPPSLARHSQLARARAVNYTPLHIPPLSLSQSSSFLENYRVEPAPTLPFLLFHWKIFPSEKRAIFGSPSLLVQYIYIYCKRAVCHSGKGKIGLGTMQ